MSKILVLVSILAGIALAGAASISSGAESDRTTLGPSSRVNIAVVDKTGGMVRLYAPEGNKVLCKGDYLPIYDSNLDVPSAGLTLPWEADQPPWYLFGPPYKDVGSAYAREFDKTLSGTDVRNLRIIGQVRVDNLVGDKYAEGTLITGDTTRGNMASKPSSQCQPRPLTLVPRG